MKIVVPPLKIQGIKTKLIPMIKQSILWNDSKIWIEPFLGSGSVLFNMQPQNAIVSDTNKHIINVYKGIQDNSINSSNVRTFLESEGAKLEVSNGEYYYDVRERFNLHGDPLDFIFLNRSCFNGMMRFNKKGDFNVPFCRKPERFQKALITRICNQIQLVSDIMQNKNWTFKVADWKDTVSNASHNDFIYLDPPYIGLHADYYNTWDENDAFELLKTMNNTSAGYALSMWKSNDFRSNYYLKHWNGIEFTTDHFYHVGASLNNRKSVIESLIVSEQYARINLESTNELDIQELDDTENTNMPIAKQLSLF